MQANPSAPSPHSTPQPLPGPPAIAGGQPAFDPQHPIAFGVPVIGEREVEAVVTCLQSRWIGAGARVLEFERQFAAYRGVRAAVALNSCTSALHLSLLALGIGSGDDVILPSMTFCATANAVIHAGAHPVLADCDRNSFNLTAAEIERRMTPRTRAIIVVHMTGRPAPMPDIIQFARKRGLRVIEDCAHAIEAQVEGRAAGCWGDVGCFSFHATKTLTTGDGGMAISGDEQLIHRIRCLSHHGLDRPAWQRNPGDAYCSIAAGFKANMTDLEAALGLVQLPALEQRWQQRHILWQHYNRLLAGLRLELPAPLPSGSDRHALHLYTPLLCLEALRADRDTIARALAAENIRTGVHYRPLHLQPYYRDRFGYQPEDFPNARDIGDRTITLPLSAALTEDQVDRVAAAFRRILNYYSKPS